MRRRASFRRWVTRAPVIGSSRGTPHIDVGYLQQNVQSRVSGGHPDGPSQALMRAVRFMMAAFPLRRMFLRRLVEKILFGVILVVLK